MKLRYVMTSKLLWLLWLIKFLIGYLRKLQPDGLQSTPVNDSQVSSDKVTMKLLVGVITGHEMNGRMSKRMVYPGKDFSKSCLDEEESIQHNLC